MRNFLFFLAVGILLLPLSKAHGFNEKGQDCSKCHTLTKDEASALFKELNPNITVLDIRTSPVSGIWEVDISAGAQKMPAYIDFSKKHLISGGIIAIKEKKNLTDERMSDLNRVDITQIALNDALVMGDKNAKHKVIVFSDPD